jgi:hypothetical protein
LYKTLNAKLTGISPLMFHNARLANPLNEIAKAMKVITSKRRKSDTDLAQLSDLEWIGGMYSTEDGAFAITNNKVDITGFGVPCLTADCVMAGLGSGATINRLGRAFEVGVIVEKDFPLIYKGPKDVVGLFQDMNFRDMRSVVVNSQRVIRTRPIFRNWAVNIEVEYWEDQVTRLQLIEALQNSGALKGWMDYRPRFGRFTVEII